MQNDKQIDEALDKQEDKYKLLYGPDLQGIEGLVFNEDEQQINYDSILATEISKQEKATVAEKLAKAIPEVIEARRALNEAIRKVEAARASILFLDKIIQYKKILLAELSQKKY
jgi:hypothetical protein